MANDRTDGSRPADKPVRADDRADKNRKAKKAALLTGGVVIRVILIAISVVAKRLATKLENRQLKEDKHEQKEK